MKQIRSSVMRKGVIAAAAILVLTALAPASDRGVRIRPNDKDVFEYVDDFSTPKFLADAIEARGGAKHWQKGALTSQGPGGLEVTYRFHGRRKIVGFDLQVEQEANGRNLGGRNTLLISQNGLDWKAVASSSSLPADGNGLQRGPLVATSEKAPKLVGQGELWVRLSLSNYSGLQTRVSNVIQSLRFSIRLGGALGGKEDPQAAARAAWGKAKRLAGWRALSLDASDPQQQRPPHYYEGSDGWLQLAGQRAHL